MPLQTIITAAKIVSRARAAFSAGAATMTDTMSAVSMTVTARARTSVPKGSPIRCATTSAWYTAANTVANRTIPATVASKLPVPKTPEATRMTQAARGHVHDHHGVFASGLADAILGSLHGFGSPGEGRPTLGQVPLALFSSEKARRHVCSF